MHAAFEWFCLSHLSKTRMIPKLFKQIGVSPLPDDKAQAFLAPQKGLAWLMDGEQSRFIVTLTEQGVCSIAGPRADGQVSTELFEHNIRHKKLTSDRIGQ